MPHFFTIQPEGFQSIRKNIITRLALVYGFLIAIIILLHFLNPPEPGTPDTWPFIILMIGGLAAFTIFSTLKRQKIMYESFRLTITETDITREIINTPAITILKKDVREIIKGPKGSFTIIGESRLNAIGVPSGIGQPEELERILSGITTLTPTTTAPWVHKFQLPIAFLVLAGIFGGIVSGNQMVSAMSFLALAALMLAGFIIIQMSKNVDRRTKLWSYIVWIPLTCIVLAFIFKLIVAVPQ